MSEEKINQNLREFFRVDLKIPVYVKKIFYINKENRYATTEWKTFFSKDISGNGIFLLKNNYISFEKDDFVLIKFDLNNDDNYIYIIAQLVRIDEEGYAFRYILVNENKVDEIVREFLKLDYEKHLKESKNL